MTSERTRRLKYIRQRPLYNNLQWNREPILLSSRANLCGTAPLNTTSTAAEIATEVLGRRLTKHLARFYVMQSHSTEIPKQLTDLSYFPSFHLELSTVCVMN